MIRCMLFLDPGGNAPRQEWKVLGHIDIENDFIHSLETSGLRGNYKASIFKKQKRRWRTVKLKSFPRLSYHPWEMIRRILNDAAEKNGGHI
jgi:hypothetical protein